MSIYPCKSDSDRDLLLTPNGAACEYLSNDFDRKALPSLRSIDMLKAGSCVRQTMRSRTVSRGFAYGRLADADTILSHCGTGGYDGTSAQSRPSITIQHQHTARLLPLHWQSGTRQARQVPSTLEGVAFLALRYINPGLSGPRPDHRQSL